MRVSAGVMSVAGDPARDVERRSTAEAAPARRASAAELARGAADPWLALDGVVATLLYDDAPCRRAAEPRRAARRRRLSRTRTSTTPPLDAALDDDGRLGDRDDRRRTRRCTASPATSTSSARARSSRARRRCRSRPAPTLEIYTDGYLDKLGAAPTVYERMRAKDPDILIWVAMNHMFRGADRLLLTKRTCSCRRSRGSSRQGRASTSRTSTSRRVYASSTTRPSTRRRRTSRTARCPTC